MSLCRWECFSLFHLSSSSGALATELPCVDSGKPRLAASERALGDPWHGPSDFRCTELGEVYHVHYSPKHRCCRMALPS